MTHRTINGLITGIAVIFASVVIASFVVGPDASSDNDDRASGPLHPIAEVESPLGVGGPNGDDVPTNAQLINPSGVVTDARTDQSLSGVLVVAEADGAEIASTSTGDDGQFELDHVPADATIVFSLDGYHTLDQPVDEDGDASVSLEPTALTGRVFGSDGSPIRAATVAIGDSHTRSDELGNFQVDDAPLEGDVIAKASGYQTKVVPRDEFGRGFTLEPEPIHGIYAAADTVASNERLGGLLDMIDRTELNALVVDLKDGTGTVHYDSQVPMAREIDAVQSTFDAEQVVREIKDRDIHAVARIAVFEDPALAEARPDLAITDTESGDPWEAAQGRAWANPYRSEVWDYNAALIQEAIDLGFDEIHLSYVHFPADGPRDRVDYGQESTEDSRQQAIDGFLDLAYEQAAPTTATIGADILPSTLLNEVDERSGQNLVSMTGRLNYVYPMLYPAHISADFFDFDQPGAHPYEVVRQSLDQGVAHLPDSLTNRLRPWLQDFSAGPGVRYSEIEVREQIDAANDAESSGWLLWNAENYYHEAALERVE